jgi:hypothetical protein
LPKENKGRIEQGEERRKESMKHFLTLTVVAAIALLCSTAMAVTVTYGPHAGAGAKDSLYAYLANGSLVELYWAGADDAIGGGDDVLVDSTTIGFGFKFNGEWWRIGVGVPYDTIETEVEYLYARVYNAATALAATESSEGSGTETLVAVVAQTPPTPQTMYFDNLRTVPEPTFMLVSGLALLLLRKKK